MWDALDFENRVEAQESENTREDIKILASVCRNLEKVSVKGKANRYRAYRVRRKGTRDGDQIFVEELKRKWDWWWDI